MITFYRMRLGRSQDQIIEISDRSNLRDREGFDREEAGNDKDRKGVKVIRQEANRT